MGVRASKKTVFPQLDSATAVFNKNIKKTEFL